MKKSVKILIAFLSVLAFMLGIIYISLSIFHNSLPKDLVYPEGNLSKSIFDSQNMKYVPNANLPVSYEFESCPYTINICDADKAKVGNGSVYELSDWMYVYFTEYAKDEKIENVIKDELSRAIMIDSNKDMSVLETYVYEEGYINGFKADYYIDCLTVSNGNRSSSVYLTGYALTITNEEYDHGYKMFVGIVTAENTTETFAQAKQVLDELIATFNFSEDTQETILRMEKEELDEEERLKKIAEQEETQALEKAKEQETTVSTGDGQNTSNADPSGQTASGEEENMESENYEEKQATITQEYTNVQLYFYYTNIDNDVNVVLFSPDKERRIEPSLSDKGVMLFNLDTMEPGKWIFGITGDYGTCSTKIYSDEISQDSADTQQ